MSDALNGMLIRHEGMRLRAYLDSKGIITIGVGRNLEDTGITEDEALTLLGNDIVRVLKEARDNFGWFASLSPARQDALSDMLFNLGLERFKGFHRMIEAIEQADWPRAAHEMLHSDWSKEVGNRANELADMMLRG